MKRTWNQFKEQHSASAGGSTGSNPENDLKKNFTQAGKVALLAAAALGLSGCEWEELQLSSSVPGSSAEESSVEVSMLRDLLPGEVQLIHITTDAQANSNLDFRLVLNEDQQIAAFRTLSQSGRRTDFAIDKLDAGIVLLRASGRDIVKLSSRDFTPSNGGNIQMTYLNDGVAGRYRNFQMELVREGSSFTAFANERSGRKRFSEMFLKKNESAFLGVIGIADVVVR